MITVEVFSASSSLNIELNESKIESKFPKIVSLYEEILEYVQKELGLSSIDVIFDGLAKKKYAMLKDEYNKFKSKYLMMKMTGGLVKKRSVK